MIHFVASFCFALALHDALLALRSSVYHTRPFSLFCLEFLVRPFTKDFICIFLITSSYAHTPSYAHNVRISAHPSISQVYYRELRIYGC